MSGWTVQIIDEAVPEFSALSPDMRAKFQRLFRLVEGHGLAALVMPLARPVAGRLWELRVTGRDGISRGLYVAASGKRVVVLRFFVKKTQKTPPREIEIALQRLKEMEP